MDTTAIEQYLQSLQSSICGSLENFEPSQRFQEERWEREEGGGGITRVLADGAVFEKAGVNYSLVSGQQLPASATAHRPELAGRQFRAMGVSLVIHPVNPYVPTSHANVRFFIAEKPGRIPSGGLVVASTLRPIMDLMKIVVIGMKQPGLPALRLGEEVYGRYKAWCDDYFYLKHRKEPRGIGGLFFDDLNEGGFERCFAFMQSVGDSFCKAYVPIIEKRVTLPYGERQRQFQLYRRGRYVEFNLVFDRGTLFGLQSGGRTESILMSLPPLVRWEYGYQPEAGSEEARLYERYLKPTNWLEV